MLYRVPNYATPCLIVVPTRACAEVVLHGPCEAPGKGAHSADWLSISTRSRTGNHGLREHRMASGEGTCTHRHPPGLRTQPTFSSWGSCSMHLGTLEATQEGGKSWKASRLQLSPIHTYLWADRAWLCVHAQSRTLQDAPSQMLGKVHFRARSRTSTSSNPER